MGDKSTREQKRRKKSTTKWRSEEARIVQTTEMQSRGGPKWMQFIDKELKEAGSVAAADRRKERRND